LDDKTLAILLNSDEEIGSLSSRKYLEEQALIHDYGLVHESGVTVNVGVISGGEARNTIAPYAEAMVDLRYPQPQHGEDAVAQFEKIFGSVMSHPIDSGEISAESWINLHRPPKVPTAESEHLLEKSLAIGRLLGQELGIVNSGGGTDGSLTQAMGLPTLDSLGVAGTGAHSNQEKTRVSSLLERAKLSAALIRRLAAE
jgi:glutamate carboxypeptidase